MFPFFPVWFTCCSSCTAPSAWLATLFCSRANSTGSPVRNSSKNKTTALPSTHSLHSFRGMKVESRNSLLTETHLVTVFSKGCWAKFKLICFGGILKGKGTQELLHNAKFYCKEIFVSLLPGSIKNKVYTLCCVVSFGDFFLLWWALSSPKHFYTSFVRT